MAGVGDVDMFAEELERYADLRHRHTNNPLGSWTAVSTS